MTLVCLVRHGAYALLDHALGGRDPHPLNDDGRAQAARAAAWLAAGPVAAVVASPVERARATAAPIAEALHQKMQIEPDFAEIDFAGWTGQSFAALDAQPAWQHWNAFRSTAGVPGGETMLSVQARAMAAIGRLSAAYPEQTVVVVSHADVIKAVLAHLLGAPLDLLRRLEIAPGSISRVALGQDDARVLSVNLLP
jgi:probable phosphoglycerate mutase